MKAIIKRVIVCVMVAMMVIAMPATAFACKTTVKTKTTTNKSSAISTGTGIYKHIDVRVDAKFNISQYIDGEIKQQTLYGKVSNVTVKLDGVAVDMQEGTTQDENSSKGVFEFKSAAGHDNSSSLDFGETSTITVAGDLSYTLDGNNKTVQFNESFVAAKSTNVCGGSGNSYGYDAEITANDIQRIVNNTVVNICKEWKDTGNESKRPESIKVDILQNDKVYKTVEVKASNNWAATVDQLPNGEYVNDSWTMFKYSVKEQAVSGYTSSDAKYCSDNDVFIITNTYSAEATESPKETKKADATKAPSSVIEDEKVPQAVVTEAPKKEKVSATKAPVVEDSSQPNTGDETPIWLFILIGVVAVGGMVTMIVISKKKK